MIISIRHCPVQVVTLCMLLFCSTLTAKVLSSKIIDSNRVTIEGATVSDGHKAVFSKADGSFSIDTLSDSLFVTRIGYQPLRYATHKLPQTIILQNDEIILPLVRVKAIEYRNTTPALDSQFIYPDTNSGGANTNEVLLSNSAFSSTDTQLVGERQTVSLLGSFSRHSLVMLDGIPLNTAGEAFDLSKIPVSQISSIEIIKGNSSVYGGSAAIGGIINIHTKNAISRHQMELAQNTTFGSFDTSKQQYSASYTRGLWYLSGEYAHYAARNNFYYDTPAWWGI
ncbi:MAG: TonB-dependent receptor plug domain-containing protein, partial [Candidatus Cloacimonas sp.]|nr:TonB-dependent receptor plug domain-containing protein [Candidatus Cloacimonas sp.]